METQGVLGQARPLEERIAEAKRNQLLTPNQWLPKEGEERAVQFIQIYPVKLKSGLDSNFFELKDLETEETLRIPAHGQLVKNCILGKCYVIQYVRKTPKGHLWKITQILDR